MARPHKQGLDYFPLDVDVFDDDKIELLSSQFGPLGEIIYLRLLCNIYRGNGYYYEIKKNEVLLLVKRIGKQWAGSYNRVMDVINLATEVGLFELSLFKLGILTSKSIQERYLNAVTERKHVHIVEDYWLLEKFPTAASFQIRSHTINGGVNLINNTNNNSKSENNSLNKSKVNDKKDKKIKFDKFLDTNLKFNFFTKCLINLNYIKFEDFDIALYNNLFEEILSNYEFEVVARVCKYIVSKSKDAKIDDRFNYFRKALINNLNLSSNNKNFNALFGDGYE